MAQANGQFQVCCRSGMCPPGWPVCPPMQLPFARPISPSHGSSDPNFSILVIAILGILASAFLLVSYYAIVAKCCTNWDTLRNRLLGIHSFSNPRHPQGELWSLHNDGLEESVIQSIPVCKYKKDSNGLVEGNECAVCLNEFQEDESLRLLPKCSHAFHLHCIDIWLQSHSNCPLCRANIINPGFESVQTSHNESSSDQITLQNGAEMGNQVQVLLDSSALNNADQAAEDGPSMDNDIHEQKDNEEAENQLPKGPLLKVTRGRTSKHIRAVSDLASNIQRANDNTPEPKKQFSAGAVQPMRRSFSMDSSSQRLCISINDLLAVHPGLHDVNTSDGSSSMKKSFFFFRNSRGRNAILPI